MKRMPMPRLRRSRRHMRKRLVETSALPVFVAKFDSPLSVQATSEPLSADCSLFPPSFSVIPKGPLAARQNLP
jgi:hypothetical protein